MLLILNCCSFSNSSSLLLAFSSFSPPKTHHFWQHGTTRHHQEQELVPQDPMRNGDRGKTSISTNSEYVSAAIFGAGNLLVRNGPFLHVQDVAAATPHACNSGKKARRRMNLTLSTSTRLLG
jgi:hypothetical protein